jgi:predicted O-methyltransferase YrrM
VKHFYKTIGGWFTFPKLYKQVVEKQQSEAHFVEVGSWMGQSASFLAVEINNSNKLIKFDCVDTWEGSAEHSDVAEVKANSLFDTFLNNIKPVNQIINPIKLTSSEASKLYTDNSLDFVFLDASHDYDNVKLDVMCWYPKVKQGGILAGHDYISEWPDVIRAVDEFILKNNYSLEINSEHCWGFTKH